jgi:high affinity Mn2+ porin
VRRSTLFAALLVSVCAPAAVAGQSGDQSTQPTAPRTDQKAADGLASIESVPPPSGDLGSWLDRLWVSGQANFISQAHPTFGAAYTGTNSLKPESEQETSRILTLYLGYRLTCHLDFIVDFEEAGGNGLSNALGVAGFPNVDVVRNPSLSHAPYVSRIMLHYVLPLSKELDESTQNPLSLAKALPKRRLEFHLGKMGTVDFFDENSIGSDSHLQFMNWATVNNGAFDYAADTRGYTYGLVAEFYDGNWAFRFGEMLMPTVANGITLDWDLARARGENFEFEYHPSLMKSRQTVIRPLAFVNHANMGNYREAIDGYLSGKDPTPDITEYRKQGRGKYGFGLNTEQELTSTLRMFARLGWNEGANESFAYTEIDRTAAVGVDWAPKVWNRPSDRIGSAFIDNGLSGDHRRYLALGGLGFILGDGGLTYGQERIWETYYTFHIWRGVSVATDLQRIWNPGYNEVRGPVFVYSFRLHLEEGLQAIRSDHK